MPKPKAACPHYFSHDIRLEYALKKEMFVVCAKKEIPLYGNEGNESNIYSHYLRIKLSVFSMS